MHAVIESLDASLATCHLSGALDHEGGPQLRAAMAACRAFRHVELDLSGVGFMDSSALGVLAGGVRRIHEEGGTVVVRGLRGNIRRLLAATGFDRIVPISDDPPARAVPAGVAGTG